MKALVLFSGGLDSLLAVKILKKQNIKVIALCFISAFFDDQKAQKIAKDQNINLITENISHPHFQVIKKPQYGYGKNMNPCLDCHGFMLKRAKIFAKKNNIPIIATGEVLGQRPMSQNLNALKTIEKIANLKNKVLRPLSALKLPETDYETTGIIQRELLEGIVGKSRKPQNLLAHKFQIEKFIGSGGGCKLTTIEFSHKLKNILKNYPKVNYNIAPFLQIGRHFWFDQTLVIFARNADDAQLMQKHKKPEHGFIKMKNIQGPHALVLFTNKKNLENLKLKIAQKILEFKKNIKESQIEFILEFKNKFYFFDIIANSI